MSRLAIKGHRKRSNEVIGVLEMLGGCNKDNLAGNNDYEFYAINDNGEIDMYKSPHDFKCFTLEAFENRFPFKVGDEVLLDKTYSRTVTKMQWYEDSIHYTLKDKNGKEVTDGWEIWQLDLYTEQEKASDREFKDACEKAVKECLFGKDDEQENTNRPTDVINKSNDINWEQVRINAAIAAMPIANEFVDGLNRYTCKGESMHSIDLFVDECVGIADALIDRLKNNK